MVAKLSSVRTMVAACLATSVPRAHRNADVCALQGRRVVDAIASHGDDMTTCLQRTNDPVFVLRRDACEHSYALDPSRELIVIHPVELDAGHDIALEAQFRCDRRGGRAVIAGDHLDRDSGLLALIERQPGFAARRIDDAYQTEEDESFGVSQQVSSRSEAPAGRRSAKQQRGRVNRARRALHSRRWPLCGADRRTILAVRTEHGVASSENDVGEHL